MIIVWRITERCNLACGFCAYDRRLPFPRREVDASLIEPFLPVLAEYQRITGDQVLLSWIGGEPLLWAPFFELSGRIRSGFGVSVSTTTNGTTLHRPHVRTAILDNLAELTVSVDGHAEFHDDVRQWQGGWRRLRSAVTALATERRERGATLKLRANVVLMHENLSQFESLCDELASWGFDEITFNQLGGRDRPDFFARHRLTTEDAYALRALLPALQGKLAAQGVRLCANAAYLDRIVASTNNQALPVNDCGPGQTFLFIDENGYIAPCSFTTAELGVPIASIRSPAQLQAMPAQFRALQRARSHTAACRDCPSTQVFSKFRITPYEPARPAP